MRVTSAWLGCALTALIPLAASLVLLYSDVNSLKHTKADKQEVMELRLEFTNQMTRNTVAIENLNETLKELKEAMK